MLFWSIVSVGDIIYPHYSLIKYRPLVYSCFILNKEHRCVTFDSATTAKGRFIFFILFTSIKERLRTNVIPMKMKTLDFLGLIKIRLEHSNFSQELGGAQPRLDERPP